MFDDPHRLSHLFESECFLHVRFYFADCHELNNFGKFDAIVLHRIPQRAHAMFLSFFLRWLC